MLTKEFAREIPPALTAHRFHETAVGIQHRSRTVQAVLAACFLSAEVISVRFGNQFQSKFWSYWTENVLQTRISGSTTTILGTSCLTQILQLLFVFVLGFTALGVLLIPAYFVGKGLLAGIGIATLYGQYGTKGILLYMTLRWLSDCFSLLLQLCLAKCAIRLSFNLCASCLGRPQSNIRLCTVSLLNRFLALVPPLLLLCVSEVLIATLSVRLFQWTI